MKRQTIRRKTMKEMCHVTFDHASIADMLAAITALMPVAVPFSDAPSDDVLMEPGLYPAEELMDDACNCECSSDDPKPTRFIPGETSVLFFDDGTKSIVTCAKDTPYSEYNAFCAAYAKRKFGSNNQLKKLIASIRVEQKNKSKKKKNKHDMEDIA